MNQWEAIGRGAAALAAVLTALGLLWRLPWVQKFVRFVDKTRHEVRTEQLRLLLAEQLGPQTAAMESRFATLDVVTAQLLPNGGSSLADRVTTISTTLAELVDEYETTFRERGAVLESHTEQLAALSTDVSTILRKVSLLEGIPR